MNVIKPTALTTAMLISSTVPEDDYAAYAAGTTYALADRVIQASTHRIYESLQAANTGHTPETSPTWWVDIGPTNRWAMFDTSVSTQTVEATSPLTIVIEPGMINSLALMEMDAISLDVAMVDGVGATVYSRAISLDDTPIIDWYTYFFEPYDLRRDLVLTDIPVYGDGRITVSLASSGTPKCGMLVVGDNIDIGDTQYGAQFGIIDYSRKETDAFGVTSFVERHYSKRMSAPIQVDNTRLGYVQRKLAELRATPCLWIGSGEYIYSPLIVFGFYRNFDIEIAYPTLSQCSLEIEGMI
jgi:hypothetical protein